jgi:hypothetical protein
MKGKVGLANLKINRLSKSMFSSCAGQFISSLVQTKRPYYNELCLTSERKKYTKIIPRN